MTPKTFAVYYHHADDVSLPGHDVYLEVREVGRRIQSREREQSGQSRADGVDASDRYSQSDFPFFYSTQIALVRMYNKDGAQDGKSSSKKKKKKKKSSSSYFFLSSLIAWSFFWIFL